MSIEEMKKIIEEKMGKLNGAQLKEVNAFINKINGLPVNEWDLSEHINTIVSEREEVFKKLAE